MSEASVESHSSDESFRVGPWLVEPPLRRVSGPGGTFRLEPKVMGVLACLAARAGEVVGRDQLMRAVWGDEFTTADVLSRAISELRRVFGDDPRDPRVVETIRGIGYRLVPPPAGSGEAPPPALVLSAESGPALADADAGPPGADTAAASSDLPGGARSRRATGRRAAAAAIAASVLVAAAAALSSRVSHAPGAEPPVRPVARPITSLPGFETQPNFSPDGSQITFIWAPRGTAQGHVFVQLVGAEAPLQITRGNVRDGSPVWSPDGHRLAFTRLGANDSCEIYVVPALGGAERLAGSCGAAGGGGLAWLPGTESIAYSGHDSPDEPFAIFSLSLPTSERRRITTPPATSEGDFAPLSRDGRNLVFVRSPVDGAGDIYTLRLADGSLRRLTREDANILALDVSADGRSVLFVSNRGRRGGPGLWRVALDGGAPGAVDVNNPGIRDVAVSPRGRRLAFTETHADQDIWALAVGAGAPSHAQPTPAISSSLVEALPRLSADGRRVVFMSNRSGSHEIWMSGIDGSNPVQLSRFEGPIPTSPAWAPDDQHIAFDVRSGGQADVYVEDVRTRRARRVTSEPSDELAPSWSGDGRWIYFSSNRSGAWEIWKMPAAGGPAARVTNRGGFGAVESRDGRNLYFTKPATNGLWRVSASGGADTLVLPDLGRDEWANFAVADSGIYFVKRDSGRGAIAFSRAGSGDVTTLTFPALMTPYLGGLTLSRDGRVLLFTRIGALESDIMLVEGVS